MSCLLVCLNPVVTHVLTETIADLRVVQNFDDLRPTDNPSVSVTPGNVDVVILDDDMPAPPSATHAPRWLAVLGELPPQHPWAAQVRRKFTKPLRIVELRDFIANINAANIATFGDFTLHQNSGELVRGTTSITLGEKETALLAAIIAASPEPLTREDAMADVFGYAKDAVTHTLETHIFRLRRKLREAFDCDIIISGVRGYSLRNDL